MLWLSKCIVPSSCEKQETASGLILKLCARVRVCVWSYETHGNSHQFQVTEGLVLFRSYHCNHFRHPFPKTPASVVCGLDKISWETNIFPRMFFSYLHLQPLGLVDQKGLFDCLVSFSSVQTIFILLNDCSIGLCLIRPKPEQYPHGVFCSLCRKFKEYRQWQPAAERGGWVGYVSLLIQKRDGKDTYIITYVK